MHSRFGSILSDFSCVSSQPIKVLSSTVSFDRRTKMQTALRFAANDIVAPITHRSMFFIKSLRWAAAMNSAVSTSLPCSSSMRTSTSNMPLSSPSRLMIDVLVRMLDEQGNEVLPAEFIAAAQRNDLMKNIDRWVIGATISFAANRKAVCIFVRLSKDTVLDKTLIGWLDTQLKSLRIEPKRLCIQVTEELATQYVRQTKELSESLRKLGFRFALEHFGTGRDPLKLLSDIGMNFIKVDGSLMQGLSTNQLQQQRVKGLVEAAKRKGVETVAERVEDANTMAVLWQLGIEFIQGYFVHAPEDVTMAGDR